MTAQPSLELELGQPVVEAPKPSGDDLRCYSVTTIIGALDKPALLYWVGEMTAVAAIGSNSWKAMLSDCDDGCQHDSAQTCAAVKWLRDARFRRPKNRLSATDLGTVVHQVCEEYALSGARPDKPRIAEIIHTVGGPGVDLNIEGPTVATMLDRFDEWLQKFTPAYQATEVSVYSPTYGYAGTTDGFLTIDGVRFIIDYKTSRESVDSKGKPKSPYPEVALQLAAYRHAELAAVWRPRVHEKWRRRYYLLSPAEQKLAVAVPEVDTGLCIHITPQACEAFPVRCDAPIHEQFLYVQEAFRWANETADTVIGRPLQPAKEVA